MCTCDQSNPVTEEYHTAFSDFETSTPEEWRTSTRYEGDIAPEYTPTPPRRTLQRDFQRAIPRIPIRSTRRMDLTAGVAIVPRRIDFDAVSDVENFDNEEDLGELARETLERLRSAAQQPYVPESTVTPGTYRVRRTRATQYPTEYKRQYAPRMTRITPCGKCLRM
ncbi:unnamed protein product [Lasius platythorax]|uniref:Uncharacterized protein n=1 Tax=Lasius platythorax TaxID=488582 RepID=A0AAV2N4I3_9HYME